MDTSESKVTSDELDMFRSELRNSSKPEALAALDVIAECEGYLEDAIPLLMLRETGTEPDRSVGDLMEKSRKFLCRKEIRAAIEAGAITPAIELLVVGIAIPLGTATAISILAFKLGMKKVCPTPNKETPLQ